MKKMAITAAFLPLRFAPIFLMIPMVANGEKLNGLIARWPLSEGQGLAIHDNAGHHHGKLTEPGWFLEKTSAFLYLAPSRYIIIPHQDDLNVEKALTLSAWINLTDTSGEQAILCKGRQHFSSGFIFLQEDGKLSLQMATEKKPGLKTNAKGYFLFTKPLLMKKTWSAVAVTYDSQKGKVVFYHNGKAVHETQAEGGVVYQPKDARLPAAIGTASAAPGACFQFNGFIREVNLYGRALSPDEIDHDYHENRPISCFKVEHEDERLEKKLTCKIHALVKDEETGTPLNCRVVIEGKEQNYVPSDGPIYGSAKNGYFSAFGEFSQKVPPGTFTITVSRGFEYRPERLSVSLTQEETQNTVINLKRLVDFPKKGWFCGEHHVHALGHSKKKLDSLFGNTPETAERGFINACMVCQAEGLNFVNFVTAMTWKTGPHYTGLTAAKDFIAYSGWEGGSCAGGHICALNCPGGKKTLKKGIFDNMDFLDDLRANGAIGLFTHPYSGAVEDASDNCVARELPLGIALEKVSAWDVFCWGDVNAAMRDWYRYLNMGFKVTATAGTDTYLNANGKPGSFRVYCKLDSLTWPEVVKSYGAGRTFVTSGPLLSFTVNERTIGETLVFPGDHPETLRLNLEAFSLAGLEKVEIIKNGSPVKTLAAAGSDLKKDFPLEIKETCWLAVKVFGKKGFCGGLAHSSPVYIQFGKHPMIPFPEDINYFIDWLDKYKKVLPEIARQNKASMAQADGLLRNIDKARAVYESLSKSPRLWTMRQNP
ncbi:MAG: CehA/McbA family metallohydrolase [Verrucomicrobiae bacterium]|nr:CehA/McbA family metallohydrolase [Verrucomicrobiae bacterium]